MPQVRPLVWAAKQPFVPFAFTAWVIRTNNQLTAGTVRSVVQTFPVGGSVDDPEFARRRIGRRVVEVV